jgi:hypothetical protein
MVTEEGGQVDSDTWFVSVTESTLRQRFNRFCEPLDR